MKVHVYGPESGKLLPLVEANEHLSLVESDPDVLICYGGDGTLLRAERQWPGLPKVPIRNSRVGNRMMAHPPEEILDRLAQGALHATDFIKLRCTLRKKNDTSDAAVLVAMNEIHLQHGRTNAAVRYALWIDDHPFEGSEEIVGDGFVISTPFGSTAYYHKVSGGIFYAGLGIAFKYTRESISHIVVPESTVIRAQLTRGPAILAYDNAAQTYALEAGDELLVSKHPEPATLLTWSPVKCPSKTI